MKKRASPPIPSNCSNAVCHLRCRLKHKRRCSACACRLRVCVPPTPPHPPMQPPTDTPASPNPPPPPPTFALPSLGTDDWLFDTRRGDGVPAVSRPPEDATRFKAAGGDDAGGSGASAPDGVERVSFVSQGSAGRSMGFANTLPGNGERREVEKGGESVEK